MRDLTQSERDILSRVEAIADGRDYRDVMRKMARNNEARPEILAAIAAHLGGPGAGAEFLRGVAFENVIDFAHKAGFQVATESAHGYATLYVPFTSTFGWTLQLHHLGNEQWRALCMTKSEERYDADLARCASWLIYRTKLARDRADRISQVADFGRSRSGWAYLENEDRGEPTAYRKFQLGDHETVVLTLAPRHHLHGDGFAACVAQSFSMGEAFRETGDIDDCTRWLSQWQRVLTTATGLADASNVDEAYEQLAWMERRDMARLLSLLDQRPPAERPKAAGLLIRLLAPQLIRPAGRAR